MNMRPAFCVLVLGDPGPFRSELSALRGVEVVWTSSVGEALSVMTQTPMSACVVAPMFESDPDLSSVVRAAGSQTPVILLGAPRRPRLTFTVEDARIVGTKKVGSLLALIADETRIPSAKLARACVQLPAVVQLPDGPVHCQATALSCSGVSLQGLPFIPLRSKVRVSLHIEEQNVSTDAVLIRWIEGGGVRDAEFVFAAVEENQRALLTRFIERALLLERGERLLQTHLNGARDAVEAPPDETVDLGGAHPRFGEGFLGHELEGLAALLRGELVPEDIPSWLLLVGGTLTPIELDALAGRAVPEWSRKAVELRTALARARHLRERTASNSDLLEDTYRLLQLLHEETRAQPIGVNLQIARIRAGLLREVVSRLVERGAVQIDEPEQPKFRSAHVRSLHDPKP